MEEIKTKYPKTYKNILEAFAGESKARNNYDFYAKVCRKEGFQELADKFEEIAKNEQEHAKLLLKLINKINDVKTNIKDCIDNENYESKTMYPEFAKIAKEEGFKEAEILFLNLAKIENSHKSIFEKYLKKIEEKNLFKSNEKINWVCKKCGNIIFDNEPPEKCPVCKHPRGYFKKQKDI